MSEEKKFFVVKFSYIRKENADANKNRPYFYWFIPDPKNNLKPIRRKVSVPYIKFITEIDKQKFIHEWTQKIIDSNFQLGLKPRADHSQKIFEIIRLKSLKPRSEQLLNQAIFSLQAYYKKDLFKIKLEDALAYKDYLKLVKNLSNTTINHKIDDLCNIYNTLLKRKLIKINPFKEIEPLKEKRQGYLPFKKAEIIHILKHIHTIDYHLAMQCKMAFYFMARPNELRLLKIGDIDFFDDMVFISEDISKTSQRNVKLPDELKTELQQYIQGINPNFYLFGLQPEPTKKNSTTEKFNKIIRNDLGYSMKHSFYSWKYTGGKEYYLSTYDLLGLMNQMGHTSPNTTWIYLKRIGIQDFRGLKGHKLPNFLSQ